VDSANASGGRTSTLVLAAILVVIAALAAVAGVIYLVKTSQSLPGFLPGRRPGNTGHDTVRGVTSLVIAAAALVGAGAAIRGGRGGRVS
jgi:hypothetical protein